MRLVDLLRGGGASQAWGSVWGVFSTPEPHNSVCLGFCPDLGSAEPPGFGRVGPLGAQRVGLADLPEE